LQRCPVPELRVARRTTRKRARAFQQFQVLPPSTDGGEIARGPLRPDDRCNGRSSVCGRLPPFPCLDSAIQLACALTRTEKIPPLVSFFLPISPNLALARDLSNRNCVSVRDI